MAGRPRKTIKKEQLPEVTRLIAAGLRENAVANYLGLAPSTFSDAKRRDPALQDAIASGLAQEELVLTEHLKKLIDDGDRSALFFYLKCRHGWIDQPHKLPGAGGGSVSININIPKPLSVDAYSKVIESVTEDGEDLKQIGSKNDAGT